MKASREKRPNELFEPIPCSSKDVQSSAPRKRFSVGDSDVTKLCDWCPVFFFEDGDCCVAGYLLLEDEYRLYRTDIVTEILEDGQVVADKDKKCYLLEGPYCKATYDEVVKFENIKAVEEFPAIFRVSFRRGFPMNWKDVIKKTLNALLLEIGIQLPKKESSTRKSISRLAELRNISSSPANTNGSMKEGENDVALSSQTKPHNFTIRSVKEDDPDSVVALVDVGELHVERLDNGGPFELISSLKRTRSGRLVKPRLDTWRGQNLAADGDNITVCLGSERDPVFLKRQGLSVTQKSREDSGYLSPIKKQRKFFKTKRRFSTEQLGSKSNRKRRYRAALATRAPCPSSESDSSQSLCWSLLKRASMRRVVDHSMSDKSVQVSPSTVATDAMTQTTETDSGIASGISSAPSWHKMSTTSVACRVPIASVVDHSKSPPRSNIPVCLSNLRCSPTRLSRQKISVSRGSCCVAREPFDSLQGTNFYVVGAERSACCCFHGNVNCYHVGHDTAIKTSTPAARSQRYSESGVNRSSARRDQSRLEQLWRMQHEIVRTMDVDLDADSDTSF